MTWSVLLFPSFTPYVMLSHHTALHHDLYMKSIQRFSEFKNLVPNFLFNQ